MRKLKLQVQMTIDGFIADQNGGMDWMIMNWSEDLKEYVRKLTDPVDTILLGRKLAEGFIPYWTAAYLSPEPEEGAKIYVATPKVVFTKTMNSSIWDNTVLAKGELATEVNGLKQREGNDMIAYGGGQFVSSLIKDRLIDELHLFINPTILGSGMSIFQTVIEKQHYKCVNVQLFDCGIVVLNYKLI